MSTDNVAGNAGYNEAAAYAQAQAKAAYEQAYAKAMSEHAPNAHGATTTQAADPTAEAAEQPITAVAEIIEANDSIGFGELIPDSANPAQVIPPTPSAPQVSLSTGTVSASSAIAVPTDTDTSIATLAETLSDNEMAQVESFSKQIDITSHAQVTSFGSQPQKRMANFSGEMLAKISTREMDVAGDLITQVVSQLKDLNVGEGKKKGILGFFRKQKTKLELVKAQYDSVEKNISKIAKDLEGRKLSLVKDAAMLDSLYDLNLTYFKELTMYLVAGKKRLEEVRQGELRELIDKAKQTGSTEDAEAVQRLTASIDRFEKKLTDLDLSRTVAMQMAPQIRLVQENEQMMVEKIQTTIVNTIPLWKSQMVLAVGLNNTEKALKAQREVTDMTNTLLRQNAERLHQSTVSIARESERGIVEIDTLRVANENLMQTLDEVLQIQADGRAKRAEAENEMRKMESELKQKMLDISQTHLPTAEEVAAGHMLP